LDNNKNIERDSNGKSDAVASFAPVQIPKQLPQLVVYVDKAGRVLRCDKTLADDSFGRLRAGRGITLPDLLHPRCNSGCSFKAEWWKAFRRLRTERITEREYKNVHSQRLLRINMLRTLDTRDGPTYAVITIVDITKGRDAILILQQMNRGLNSMFRSKASQLSEVLEIVDHNHRRMERMDARLRLLSSHVILAQEQERERISSDLHDGLGQRLSLARYTVEQCLDRLVDEGAPESAVASLRDTIVHLEESISEMHDVVQGLKPSILKDLGLTASLELLAREFEANYSNLRFDVEIDASEIDVSYELSVAIYRITQEALTNIMKHANASRVEFGISNSQWELRLNITDDGQGFDADLLEKSAYGERGYGLANIRERAMATGGRCEIISSKRRGTTVSVVWQIGST
jgi:signal transduction histidine kinase